MKVELSFDRPVPAERLTYPWQEMEVGQSFVVDIAHAPRIRTLASSAGKRWRKKFTTRRAADGTVVVWRIA